MIHINVWWSVDGFLGTPIEDVNQVVTVSQYIFYVFYFIAGFGYMILVLIGEYIVF